MDGGMEERIDGWISLFKVHGNMSYLHSLI